jgi:dTDP-4-dehydrorhamnose reductase
VKILVLGAGGMAGHVIALHLKRKGYSVDTLSAKHALDQNTQLLDVTNGPKLKRFLKSEPYDIVINCVAVLVRQSEEHKDIAVYLNAYLPHFLENYYRDSKTRVIHLSTDGVFSNKNSPYKEDSDYDGQGFYDRSKALGEIINNKDLTMRLSIVGPDIKKAGTGLFNWFLQQRGEITGYSRIFWRGVTTIELAKGVEEAIKQNISGIYHFIPKASISKFELLRLFQHVFNHKNIIIKPDDGPALDRELLNTRNDFNFAISDYRTMVEEMKIWIESHKHLYKHYS